LAVGASVSAFLGAVLGKAVGAAVGGMVGATMGELLGTAIGSGVSAMVGIPNAAVESDKAHVSHHIHDGCKCLDQHSIAFLLQIHDLWIHSSSHQCFLVMINDRVGFGEMLSKNLL